MRQPTPQRAGRGQHARAASGREQAIDRLRGPCLGCMRAHRVDVYVHIACYYCWAGDAS
jgi:hypothetical protein